MLAPKYLNDFTLSKFVPWTNISMAFSPPSSFWSRGWYSVDITLLFPLVNINDRFVRSVRSANCSSLPSMRPTSETVAGKLKNNLCHHGMPETLVSDNGTQFSLAEFNKFVWKWQFVHKTKILDYCTNSESRLMYSPVVSQAWPIFPIVWSWAPVRVLSVFSHCYALSDTAESSCYGYEIGAWRDSNHTNLAYLTQYMYRLTNTIGCCMVNRRAWWSKELAVL